MNPFQIQTLFGRSLRTVLDVLGIGRREIFVENNEHNMREIKKALLHKHDANV